MAQGKAVRDSIAPVVPGQRVKVHFGKACRYGEVIGVRQDKRLLLSERKDFGGLTVSGFDHFRDKGEVIFLEDQENIELSAKPLVLVDNPVSASFHKLKNAKKPRRCSEDMAEEARQRILKRRSKTIARAERSISRLAAKKEKLATAIARTEKLISKWIQATLVIDKKLATSLQDIENLKRKYKWQK
jgi:hypothetical protein